MKDLHTQYSHRWLSPKAIAYKSPIHGLGVKARQLISKGEIIGVLGGVIVPVSEIDSYWKVMGHVGIQIDDDFFIVPTTRTELEEKGVFNHSCTPNCGFTNSITLIAIKEIYPEQEITFDYAFNETYMENFNCSCKSPDCRKIITSLDWKNRKIQDNYGQYFSPYLRQKIYYK